MGLVGRRDAGGKKRFILQNWQEVLQNSSEHGLAYHLMRVI